MASEENPAFQGRRAGASALRGVITVHISDLVQEEMWRWQYFNIGLQCIDVMFLTPSNPGVVIQLR